MSEHIHYALRISALRKFGRKKKKKKRSKLYPAPLELVIRLERTTCSLRMSCTTDCATQAFIHNFISFLFHTGRRINLRPIKILTQKLTCYGINFFTVGSSLSLWHYECHNLTHVLYGFGTGACHRFAHDFLKLLMCKLSR